MFPLFCKLLRSSNVRNLRNSTAHSRLLLQNDSIVAKFFSSVEVVTNDNADKKKEHSFTVSYLMKSCGLSPESASSVSKKVNFESPEKPDYVLGILRDHGFTDKHISKLVMSYPVLLVSRADKTLLPKLEFFRSVGISGTDLANMLSTNRTILRRSLENQIIPIYKYLKGFLSDDAKILLALKRALFFHRDVEKNVVPNISSLREIGVPKSRISSQLISNPGVLCQNHEKFDKSVKWVLDMGFDPSRRVFLQALAVVSEVSHQTWEQKVMVYRSWDWSEDDFWSAFRKYPICMSLSVENINAKMDFYINKMGWQPSDVARAVSALAYSFENRVIPRCSVIRVLQSKDLIKEQFSLYSVVESSNKYFMDTFVTKYQREVPQLLDIFEGKTDLSELVFEQKYVGKQL